MEGFKNTHKHFIIYKPYGYISQFYSNSIQQKNKNFLGELHDFPEGIMPIGRLDEKSEGLLLLTTDGKTSNYINSQKVKKMYYIQWLSGIKQRLLDFFQKIKTY